ncbi:hypothetical protein B0T14DRAFT_189881 [Immersiella caudata]|uniref:Uncharacterized protein n=1 Tax=Immersiella caudata TaxID=314043 RepID=A0AA39WY98_9PEZI|nr:hypothetical protein B0T14DRAFT_189881 [Immersiella caudata]
MFATLWTNCPMTGALTRAWTKEKAGHSLRRPCRPFAVADGASAGPRTFSSAIGADSPFMSLSCTIDHATASTMTGYETAQTDATFEPSYPEPPRVCSRSFHRLLSHNTAHQPTCGSSFPATAEGARAHVCTPTPAAQSLAFRSMDPGVRFKRGTREPSRLACFFCCRITQFTSRSTKVPRIWIPPAGLTNVLFLAVSLDPIVSFGHAPFTPSFISPPARVGGGLQATAGPELPPRAQRGNSVVLCNPKEPQPLLCPPSFRACSPTPTG